MNLIPPSFSLAIVRLNINSQDSNHHVETHTRGMECESSMCTRIDECTMSSHPLFNCAIVCLVFALCCPMALSINE